MKTLLLLDANSLIHRMFHALPPLSAPDGRPTGALYGVARILLKLWREGKPDFAAAAFDRPEPTFRKLQFPAYKAQRPPTPGELVTQIIAARDLFAILGITSVECPGVEADDIIATLAEKFRREEDLKIIVLTGDLDSLQLVDDGHIAIRTFKKGISDTIVYNSAAVRERYGLAPNQLVDYKALVGDASDNVPGVPGVGPKTASGWLAEYHTLDALLQQSSQDAKLRAKLEPFRKQILLSRELVTLKRDAELPIQNLEQLRVRDHAPGEPAATFRQLGFDSLVPKPTTPTPPPRTLGGLFAPPTSSPVDAGDESRACWVISSQTAAWPGQNDPRRIKIGFDLKTALKRAWAQGQDLVPPYADLGVAFWLLEPDLKDYAPATVAARILGRDGRLNPVRNEDSNRVNERDLAELYAALRTKLQHNQLLAVFEQVEMPVLRILAEMEQRGIRLDAARLVTIQHELGRAIQELEQKIYRSIGHEFNLNSPAQLATVLFEELKLLPPSAVRASRSTDAERLAELSDRHPAISSILAYREHFKIRSTYILPLLELARSIGRAHTEFIQTGTATGRLSSQNPNLQNIPRDSPWAPALRSVFQSDPGHTLVTLDYSQLELRILAVLSGDPQLLQVFRQGGDVHRATAAEILGKPLSAVTDADRRIAKTLNFGLIYGMGESAFARTGGIDRAAARQFIAAYFQHFRGVRDWQEATQQTARTLGYTQTLTGRRRYFPEFISNSPRLVAAAGRAAINHPVQGSGADLIKLAMIRARAELVRRNSWDGTVQLLLSIHDELLFQIRDDKIEETIPVLREAMERAAPELGVPISVKVCRRCSKTLIPPLAERHPGLDPGSSD
ncbi:MAG: hypothetical protein HY978_01300 [Candidatus Liptonbacteria bacterium]|nr:hypothetical protein [Candidatus Liptonbacteria bacterium]